MSDSRKVVVIDTAELFVVPHHEATRSQEYLQKFCDKMSVRLRKEVSTGAEASELFFCPTPPHATLSILGQPDLPC